MLTATQAAQALGLARNTIYNQIAQGTFRVKTYVDGGKRFADYRDLAKYLDEVRAGATTPALSACTASGVASRGGRSPRPRGRCRSHVRTWQKSPRAAGREGAGRGCRGPCTQSTGGRETRPFRHHQSHRERTLKPTMTTADIAQLVGVTRRHVTGQIVKRPGFPAPCINASQRLRAWPTKKVLAYFQGIGRTIEPASGNAEITGLSG